MRKSNTSPFDIYAIIKYFYLFIWLHLAHYKPSQSFTQVGNTEPFTQNCHGSYKFFLKNYNL